MRTCYVALPSRACPDPDGRMLDFEHLYRAVLQPALAEWGVDGRRFEELARGASWERSALGAILSSDLMIADVSTHDPNVLYELGVRHALRRGGTLVICAGGDYAVAAMTRLVYQVDASGRVTGAAADDLRARLRDAVLTGHRATITDSPVFTCFPGLEVVLPPELGAPTQRESFTSRGGELEPAVRSLSVDALLVDARQRELEVRTGGKGEPMDFIKLLRRYRDASAWDEVIRLASEAPSGVAQLPEVCQLLALALNRRGDPGDQERAIALLEQLIAQTGGDSGCFGVLGRIYKDRRVGDPTANLDRALECYRAGFDLDPNDHYTGVNMVSLLHQRGTPAALAELARALPRVRALVDDEVAGARPDLRRFAARMQLAAIAGDWDGAERAAHAAIALASAGWMLESARRELHLVGARLSDPAQRARCERIEALLQTTARAADA